MGGIGIWQIVLVLAIVLILFGAGKLPKVMGDLAKGVKTFRSGLKDEEEGGSTGVASTSLEQDKPSPVAKAAGEKDDVLKS
mgnify:CR=1 FL=1